MRKIKTREEIEKSDKRRAWIIGVVLIFLMLFSTAGYAILSGGGFGGTGSESNIEDGSYNGNFWIYQRFGTQLFFVNSLNEVSDIPVDISLGLADYSSNKVFVDSAVDYVSVEISGNLGQFTSQMQPACYGTCEENLPEKGCDELLIVFRESSEQRVYQEDYCVFIEGDLKAVDAFLYNIFGISA